MVLEIVVPVFGVAGGGFGDDHRIHISADLQASSIINRTTLRGGRGIDAPMEPRLWAQDAVPRTALEDFSIGESHPTPLHPGTMHPRADRQAAVRGRTSTLMRAADASSAMARSYFACRFIHI